MPSQPKTVRQMMSQTGQCIKNCLDCHRHCLAIITHCLEMGGKHAEHTHITLLLNCAEICQTTAQLMVANVTEIGEA